MDTPALLQNALPDAVRKDILGILCMQWSASLYRDFLRGALAGNACVTVHTINPEMLVDARRQPEFRDVLARGTWCVPDGVGLRYACMALYGEVMDIHPGADTIGTVLDLAYTSHARIAVCGARAREHEAFTAFVARRAPGSQVLCIDPGIIDERDPHVALPSVEALVRFAPDVIFVALGQGKGLRQGKQEHVVQQLKEQVKGVKIIIGIGGALDMLSGRVERAPLWLRKRNLEWAYRMVVQPWRFLRIAKAFFVFPLFILWEVFKQRTLLRSTVRVVRLVFSDVFLKKG